MIRLSAALLGVFSWSLAAFFSVRFPISDSLAAGRLGSGWIWGWVFVLAGVLSYFAWMRPFKEGQGQGQRPSYGERIMLSLALQAVLALIAASVLHRDFYTLLFQSAAIHFGLFIDAAPLYRSRFYLVFADRLFAITLFIVGFFLFWIALMGYAIAARTEPRWIPSIGYNVLNLGICGFISIANFNLRDRSKRELVVTDTSVLLDNLDVLPLFSPSARPLVFYFASPGGRKPLVCQDAQGLVGAKECDRDCTKATTCAEYRYLYNRVHEVKKVFSALKIGRISSPENRQTILEKGWSFVPDPSVLILSPASPKADGRG